MRKIASYWRKSLLFHGVRGNVVRKTKEEALETRDRLLDAAGEVFSEKGVTRASLDDIARAAGLTRGAIYWHFKNKTDLIEALWGRTKMPLDDAWGNCCASAECDPLGRIRDNAVGMLKRAATDANTRQIYDILFNKCECVGEGERVLARKLESRQECTPTIANFFKAAIKAGQLPAGLDPDTAMAALFSYLDGLVYNSFLHPEMLRLDEQAEFYVDTFIEGLKRSVREPA